MGGYFLHFFKSKVITLITPKNWISKVLYKCKEKSLQIYKKGGIFMAEFASKGVAGSGLGLGRQ